MQNRIRELRQKRGISQIELGKILRIRNNAISRYENNICEPSVKTWAQMAEYFEVSIDYLMGGAGMISISEPDVVYCCFVTDGGKYLAKQDTKIYKRKGDATKRVKKLNLTTEFDWIVLAASGWHEVEK